MVQRNNHRLVKREDLLVDDVKFFINLIYKLLRFIILLPFRLVYIVLMFLFNDRKASRVMRNIVNDFKDLVSYPVRWFFAAKTTVLIGVLLIFFYLLQAFILPNFGQQFANRPSDIMHLDTAYTLLTSLFLHGGIWHLLGNLAGLLLFGRRVERHFRGYTFLIFLGAGLIANIISSLINLFVLNSSTPAWGASGGIAGLIMLAILLEPFALTFGAGIPLPYFVIGWALIYSDIAARNLQDNIGHYAHLGGYFGVLIFLFIIEHKNKKKLLNGIIINLAMLILFYVFNLFRFVKIW